MTQVIRTQNFVDELTNSFAELGRDIGEAVPRIVAALLILLVGYWIAKLIRRFVNALLEKVGAGKLTRATGIEPTLEQAGTSGVKLIGQVIFFLVFLIFIQLAAEALGIDELTQLLTDLISYLPLIVVALIVFFVAAAIANWAGGVVRPFAESRNMGWISTAVRIGILVFGALAALDVLNLAPSVVSKVENTLLQYLPLSILLAGTIAFGVGGIKTAQQWWAKVAPRPNVGAPAAGGTSPAGGASPTEGSSWPER